MTRRFEVFLRQWIGASLFVPNDEYSGAPGGLSWVCPPVKLTTHSARNRNWLYLNHICRAMVDSVHGEPRQALTFPYPSW